MASRVPKAHGLSHRAGGVRYRPGTELVQGFLVEARQAAAGSLELVEGGQRQFHDVLADVRARHGAVRRRTAVDVDDPGDALGHRVDHRTGHRPGAAVRDEDGARAVPLQRGDHRSDVVGEPDTVPGLRRAGQARQRHRRDAVPCGAERRRDGVPRPAAEPVAGNEDDGKGSACGGFHASHRARAA